MSFDFEQLQQESTIFHWLDSDCMSDSCDEDFFDEINFFEEEEDCD